MFPRENLPVHDTLEKILPITEDKGDHRSEPCFTITDTLHLPKHLLHVRLRVVGGSGITGGIDTRGVIKCFYFQSGIIRETIVAELLVYIPRFLQGIPLQCILLLGDILVASDVFQGNDLVPTVQHFPDFSQLVRVVSREN